MVTPEDLQKFMQDKNFHAMLLVVLSPDGNFTYVKCTDQLIVPLSNEMTKACIGDKLFQGFLATVVEKSNSNQNSNYAKPHKD